MKKEKGKSKDERGKARDGIDTTLSRRLCVIKRVMDDKGVCRCWEDVYVVKFNLK